MKHDPPDYKQAVIRRIRQEAMKIKGVTGVRHIHPRAYCIAKPAACCAVFVVPPCDHEPHLRSFEPNNSAELIQNNSAAKVKVGDWCSLAYVITHSFSQPQVILINNKPLK